MGTKWKDRLFLVIAALICSGVMVTSIVFVKQRFSDEWSKFIFASTSYFVVLIAMGFTDAQLKRLSKTKIILFQVVYFGLTVGGALLIFRYWHLSLPHGSLTYILPMTMLSALSLVVLDYLRKRSNYFDS